MKDYLLQLKSMVPSLAGVCVLLIALFKFENVVPEPVNNNFNQFATIMVLIALITTYFFRKWILSNYRLILFVTVGLLVFFLIFHSLFVIEVNYDDVTSKNVLVGSSFKDSYADWESDSELLKQTGTDLGDLRMVYQYYDLFRIFYLLIFLGFIFALVFCLGGLTNEKNPQTSKRNKR